MSQLVRYPNFRSCNKHIVFGDKKCPVHQGVLISRVYYLNLIKVFILFQICQPFSHFIAVVQFIGTGHNLGDWGWGLGHGGCGLCKKGLDGEVGS